MNKVGILDYGMGNIRSVANAVEELGAQFEIIDLPVDPETFSHWILPGVGAFGDAMAMLRERGLDHFLHRLKERKALTLGICLGMQLMCRESLEGGRHDGLGWIDAKVIPLPAGKGLKIPHMGWNDLRFSGDSPLFRGLGDATDVYFVHSFHAVCAQAQDVSAWCRHGSDFTAAFSVGPFHGTQFHPEKSQQAGLHILRNFLELSPC